MRYYFWRENRCGRRAGAKGDLGLQDPTITFIQCYGWILKPQALRRMYSGQTYLPANNSIFLKKRIKLAIFHHQSIGFSLLSSHWPKNGQKRLSYAAKPYISKLIQFNIWNNWYFEGHFWPNNNIFT